MSSPLRIAINAEFAPRQQAGGTQSVLTGLVHALGQLAGEEEYIVIVHPQNRAWIEPHVGSNTRLVDRPQKATSEGSWLYQRLRRWVRGMVKESDRPAWPGLPVSGGWYESLGCQAIHFPFQHFVLCALPAIFNPHDLLHLHFPSFFTAREIMGREALYPTACRLAHTVVTGSQWIKDDVSRRYAIAPERFQVIPWAPPTQVSAAAEGDPTALVHERFGLTEPFAFYPAVTWEHKNHLRLLQALAQVRDREHRTVHLVCTGHRFQKHWPVVAAEISRLGLDSQVHFLGEVSVGELRAVYRAAQFVIVPTLFEAASGPVFEAWQEGTPAACSNVTSLPEQAGDAALLFDPYSVDAIASAISRMSAEEELRRSLQANARRRLGDFSWERTAQAYRAVYRRAAGRTLSAEDEKLLQWDWMRNPAR